MVGIVVEIGFLRLSSAWSVRCYRQEGLASVWGRWVGEFVGGGKECWVPGGSPIFVLCAFLSWVQFGSNLIRNPGGYPRNIGS